MKSWIAVVVIFLVGWSWAYGNPASDLGSLEGTLKVTAPPRKTAPEDELDEMHSFYDNADYDTLKARHPVPEEVVVYLKKVPGNFTPPKEHVKLDQKYLQFTHHVIPVLKGTVVDFTNHDPVYHNVFTNSQANSFHLGKKSRGEKSSVKMVRSEVPVKVYCEIHSDMKSNILVLDNPFFTTVKPGQKFRLEGIPPGTYTLAAWHDYWATMEKEVTVVKGATARADITLSQVQK